MPEININEVRDIVQHMANGKATGPDGVPNELVKYGGEAVSEMIFCLLSKCWTSKNIPEEIKRTRICMIPKQGNRTDPANLRPIALNQCFFRIYDKIILNRVMEYNRNRELVGQF